MSAGAFRVQERALSPTEPELQSVVCEPLDMGTRNQTQVLLQELYMFLTFEPSF